MVQFQQSLFTAKVSYHTVIGYSATTIFDSVTEACNNNKRIKKTETAKQSTLAGAGSQMVNFFTAHGKYHNFGLWTKLCVNSTKLVHQKYLWDLKTHISGGKFQQKNFKLKVFSWDAFFNLKKKKKDIVCDHWLVYRLLIHIWKYKNINFCYCFMTWITFRETSISFLIPCQNSNIWAGLDFPGLVPALMVAYLHVNKDLRGKSMSKLTAS